MTTRTTQGQAESPARRVIDHIAAERFTGVLRVRAREADGELWFLAGIEEDARFGMSKGDEAMARLLRATEPVFDAEQRLPGLNGGFKNGLSPTGSFADVQPVDLMRYCERFALTCVLDLKGTDRAVRITYRTGELLSADTGSGGDEVLASLLESIEGSYQFELPPFELPSGVNRPRISLRPGGVPGTSAQSSATAGAAGKTSLAERVDLSLASETDAQAMQRAAAETQRKAEAEDEARRLAEASRRAGEEREARERLRAEEARKADERRRDEAEREAEAERQADARRKAAGRPREFSPKPAAVERARPKPAPAKGGRQWVWLLLALLAIVVANYFLRRLH